MKPQPAAQALDPARFTETAAPPDTAGLAGRLPIPLPTRLHTLRLPSGVQVAVTNLGAKVLQILLPDRTGHVDDITLGYDSINAVRTGAASMGAFIGRYANRIANARFLLGGQAHRLTANDGLHCLHGGVGGSRHRVFASTQPAPNQVTMLYTFADGEEGFPGEVPLTVNYILEQPATLRIVYHAGPASRATVASFTSHIFFNLAGRARPDVLEHRFQIEADQFLVAGADKIPTGDIRQVWGSAMDLTTTRILADLLLREEGQLALTEPRGFDHAYVCRSPGIHPGDLQRNARVVEPRTGRTMEVWSTEPSIQFYTGQMLGSGARVDKGKSGQLHLAYSAFCLEPQRYPDAPNQPSFPSAVLAQGETLHGEIQYRFAADA